MEQSMSPEEQEAQQAPEYLEEEQERDVELSLALLSGTYRRDNDGLPYVEFLSRGAENDARDALCRLLWAGVVPWEVRYALARVFEPGGPGSLKAVLKRRTQGHPTNFYRDIEIAIRVYDLRKKGQKNAIAKVAKEIGKDQRTVGKIYSKYREECEHYREVLFGSD
jgi:hypothetical protein